MHNIYIYINADVCIDMYACMPISTYRQNEVRDGKNWAETGYFSKKTVSGQFLPIWTRFCILCFSNMLDIHELVFDLSKPSFIF
jgi:hypothetical protein